MQVVDETVVLPQFLLVEKSLRSSDVDDIPVVAQMRLPMVLQTIEIPQLHVDMVIDGPGVRVQRVPRDSRAPTGALVEKFVEWGSSSSR